MGSSYLYIIVPVVAWLFSKAVKIFSALCKREKITPHLLMRDGGMPSSHAALVVAESAIIGWLNGVDSAMFGVSFCLAVIVMHDAVNVRRRVGEQGVALNRLLKKDDRVPDYCGHRLVEVLVGSLVGFLTSSFLVVLMTN